MSHFNSKDIEDRLIWLTLSLYNNPLIPRMVVQFFIDNFINFIYNILFPILEDKIKDISGINEDIRVKLKEIFASTRDIFTPFTTEYNRFELYKKRGLMKDPLQSFFQEIDGQTHCAFSIPLSFTLKLLFESPGVLDLLEKNMEELQNVMKDSSHPNHGVFTNFIQCQSWLETKKKFLGKFVIPLFFLTMISKLEIHWGLMLEKTN